MQIFGIIFLFVGILIILFPALLALIVGGFILFIGINILIFSGFIKKSKTD